MTKGKYAAKAAMRKAELEVTTDLKTYQKRVAELIAENKALKSRLTEKDRAHSTETRRLRAMIREGVSPSLAVAEEEARRQRERADRLHAQVVAHDKRYGRMLRAISAHCVARHDMKPLIDLDRGASGEVSGLLRISPEVGQYLNAEFGTNIGQRDTDGIDIKASGKQR